MEAGKIKIEGIFNPGRYLKIPFFQRGYVWGKENWERFLEDCKEVSEGRRDYFLGSVILKSIETPSTANVSDWRMVIDGQQRLTTIAILMKALYEVKNNDVSFMRTFYNRDNVPGLKHNHMDNEIFQAIISGNLTEKLETEYKGNRILECYRYFKDNSDELSKLDVNQLLNHIYFVGIDLGREEDEQQIFDTINSLGVRLTVAELLKNHLYSDEHDEGLYSRTWQLAFENDKDSRKFWDTEISSGRTKRSNIELLLQSYFSIKTEGEDFKVYELFQEYKKYLDTNMIMQDRTKKEDFISDLITYSKLYREYVNPDNLDSIDDSLPVYVQRMNILFFQLDTSTVIPYFLYVLQNVKDEEERNSIFNILESYFVRRFICSCTTKNYNRFVKALIKEKILTSTDLVEFLKARNDSEDSFPGDNRFQKAFKENTLYNVTAKGILYLLELSVRNNEKQQTLLKGINSYDLEHIMPQKWESNWKINAQSSEEYKILSEKRNVAIYTIGNMTILSKGLNRSIHNADWLTKKNGTTKWEGLVKFGEGIETFSPYIKLEDWNEETIANRGDDLLTKSLMVWKGID